MVPGDVVHQIFFLNHHINPFLLTNFVELALQSMPASTAMIGDNTSDFLGANI